MRRLFRRQQTRQQNLAQLVGYACPAQVAHGVRRIDLDGALRVDIRDGGWQVFREGMMIGDDSIDAQTVEQTDFRKVGDAGVRSNHQLDLSGAGQADQGRRVQPVAFRGAIRNIKAHFGLQVLFERFVEDGRASDAIHVEVAIDQNRLIGLNRPENTLNSLRHVGQLQTAARRVLRQVEKRPDSVRRRQAPARQQRSQQRRAFRCRQNIRRKGRVGLRVAFDLPDPLRHRAPSFTLLSIIAEISSRSLYTRSGI